MAQCNFEPRENVNIFKSFQSELAQKLATAKNQFNDGNTKEGLLY